MFDSAPDTSASVLPIRRRRRISPEAGRALEILSHAIEYITDEFVHEGSLLVYEDAHLEAVRLLKAFNRQIYFECPVVPTLRERCRSLLFGKPA
jgi:hypothetical protein